MALLKRFESPRMYRGGYLSIGNFDGVHVGHRQIAKRLADCAKAANVPAVVLTFDPHPLKLLRPEHVPPSLTTLEHKSQLLEESGVTCVIAYPTDRKLLQLTPEEFFDAIVVAEIRAKGLVEGPNFCFGRDRRGDVATLRELCQRRGVSLEIAEPIGELGRMVSSSAIRSLIESGKMAEAVELLGHPYRIAGDVVTGASRGHTIGFPTANLAHVETLLPADGVYAGIAPIDGRPIAAAVSIGPNSTFHESGRKIEAHLIDFSGDLYGRRLAVDLLHRLRDIRRFENADELTRQIALDVAAARACLSPAPGPRTR